MLDFDKYECYNLPHVTMIFGGKSTKLETHFGRRPFFLEITMILVQKMGCFLYGPPLFLCVKMALGSKKLDTPKLDFLGGCGPHFYWDEEKWPYTYLSSTTLL